MQFWGQSETEKQQQARQAATRKALEQGGIPPEARHRLEAQRLGGDRFFTSDLTCNEYLLTRTDYEPIGLVMGTAFYKVSFWGYFNNYQTFTGELSALSQAQLAARELAISRLQQEAALLGAAGVIGVRLQIGGYDWSSRTVEFTAIGTAIRVKNREPNGKPFTSNFSGQEFWQLHQAGYWPKGLVFGICSYYVHSDYNTRSVMNNNWWSGGWANQELTQYTQGFQLARHLAMNRLSQDLRQHQAEGAVGMKIDADIEEVEYEINDVKYRDLLAHFVAVGTSITHDDQPTQASIKSPLLFYNLASGKLQQLEKDEINDE
ncbi:MAG: heavy metal-binding domain-containing protein [Chroococcidiopsidaceae cyanobacterium CP_BM_ER_R8_30]|nr:heavy metal-binding domain-containing protein [Chroococcidiopsidaceae cyanobacterium CP_BM_ER_R8_30]